MTDKIIKYVDEVFKELEDRGILKVPNDGTWQETSKRLIIKNLEAYKKLANDTTGNTLK